MKPMFNYCTCPPVQAEDFKVCDFCKWEEAEERRYELRRDAEDYKPGEDQ